MTKLNLNIARLLSEINLTWQKKRGLKTTGKKPHLLNVGEEWKLPQLKVQYARE